MYMKRIFHHLLYKKLVLFQNEHENKSTSVNKTESHAIFHVISSDRYPI